MTDFKIPESLIAPREGGPGFIEFEGKYAFYTTPERALMRRLPPTERSLVHEIKSEFDASIITGI